MRTEYRALDSQVLAVAVEGYVGDWSAYIGSVLGRNHEQEWQEVREKGSKLPQAVAEILFPKFAEALAWRN